MVITITITTTMDDIIWSKGPHRAEYSRGETDTPSSERAIIHHIESVAGPVLWIRTGRNERITDINLVARHLDKLAHPVVLLTSDGDRPVPGSYPPPVIRTILDHPKILAWHTQNYDGSTQHAKLHAFPIGFDFHTEPWLVQRSPSKTLQYMLAMREQSMGSPRDPRIFCDAHLSPSHPDRHRLRGSLANNKHIVMLPRRVAFEGITKLYNRYTFALSPRGNGLDCHRTWELLLAGAIVITKTSPLDAMYRDNQLPVVIISNWETLTADLPNKMARWKAEHSRFTALDHILPRLKFGYWLGSSAE
jgi:hypothetical protein